MTDVDTERLAVRTADGRTDAADALVVAAGPWTPRLLPALRGRVTPSRQVALYLEPPPDLLAAWRAAPAVLDQFEAARGGFAVPPVDGTRLKVGDHVFTLRGEPDAEREPTEADRTQTMTVARSRLVGFERYRAGCGQDLLLQRRRGRTVHRRAGGTRAGPRRLLRSRLQVRRRDGRGGRRGAERRAPAAALRSWAAGRG